MISVPEIEDLCNGSTPDSDSVCGGSNPSSSAKKKILSIYRQDFLFVFFIFHYSTFIIHLGQDFLNE